MGLRSNQKSLESFLRDIDLDLTQSQITEALTHPSVREYDQNIKSNEQLETLGDAVLDLLVGHYLIKKYPEIESGQLTQFRSSLVNNRTLSKLGMNLGIKDLLNVTEGYEINTRDIANAIEAIFGAIFLISGFDKAELFFEFIKETLENLTEVDKLDNFNYFNPIGKLQEFTQKRRLNLPKYEIIEQIGPDHNPQFKTQCTIYMDDITVKAIGSGTSKKSAREHAAINTLNQLSQLHLLK